MLQPGDSCSSRELRELAAALDGCQDGPLRGTAGPQPGDRQLLRKLALVGLPVYPVALVQRLLGLLSAALVGHLGDTEALAAIGLCNVISNITGYSWLWGLSGAISTLSAQAWGARSYHAVGLYLQRGFLVLVCFADLPLLVLWLSADRCLEAVGQPPEVSRLVGLYMRLRIPGVFFETVNVVLNRTLTSIEKSRITMLVTVPVILTNVALSFLLIPTMGFLGAPIVATTCDAVQVFAITILAFRDPDFRQCWSGLTRDAWRGWGAFLRLSCPSLALLVVEWWTWDLQSFLAGFISPQALATQSVAPQITDLQYSVGQALNNAACTVIGNLLGEGRPAAARRAACLIMAVCAALMAVQAGLFLALRTKIPRIFTTDETILEDIAALLPLTLLFSFLDGQQCALAGVLVAAGRQGLAAPLIFFCYWVVGVPLGALLAFGKLGGRAWGLTGLWTGMLVAVVLHVLCFSVAVLRLDWEKAACDAQRHAEAERLCSNAGVSLVLADSEGVAAAEPPLAPALPATGAAA